MRLSLLTPGTGHFICGSCLRDRALAVALKSLGHDVSVVPLYLPLVLEEKDDADERVFMGGLNMYLQQKSALFKHIPRWLARLLDSPALLRWSSARGDMTGAAAHAAMVLSMLRGEEGRQALELEKLSEWLAAEPPDVVCLSNALLIGLARRLRGTLDRPVLCTLQGEAPFLNALPEAARREAWQILSDRAKDIDAFIAVSRSYGDLMTNRLDLDPARVHLVYNGIELDGLPVPPAAAMPAVSAAPAPPTIGYLARLCRDKGLHTLVDAFIELKRRGRIEGLKLKAAGVMLAGDKPFVRKLQEKLRAAGCERDAEFLPNVDRPQKIRFLHSLTVMSVPATYGESFGLYVLEALAAGVPVVEPRHGAFPELLEATGGGLLCEPDDPLSLARALEALLLDGERRSAMAEQGRRAVAERFTADRMARDVAGICMMLASR